MKHYRVIFQIQTSRKSLEVFKELCISLYFYMASEIILGTFVQLFWIDEQYYFFLCDDGIGKENCISIIRHDR